MAILSLAWIEGEQQGKKEKKKSQSQITYEKQKEMLNKKSMAYCGFCRRTTPRDKSYRCVYCK